MELALRDERVERVLATGIGEQLLELGEVLEELVTLVEGRLRRAATKTCMNSGKRTGMEA